MSPGFYGPPHEEFVTQAGPVEMLREPDVQGAMARFLAATSLVRPQPARLWRVADLRASVCVGWRRSRYTRLRQVPDRRGDGEERLI